MKVIDLLPFKTPKDVIHEKKDYNVRLKNCNMNMFASI